MRTTLTLLFTAALAATLSACSLFGPDVESLETATLLQSSDLVAADGDPQAPAAPFITSAEEEAAFRARYGIAEPFPTVDYSADLLVAVVEAWPSPDARVTVDAVELVGDDRVRVRYTVSGAPSGDVDRYPIHVVRTRRADLSARRVQLEASYPSRN